VVRREVKMGVDVDVMVDVDVDVDVMVRRVGTMLSGLVAKSSCPWPTTRVPAATPARLTTDHAHLHVHLHTASSTRKRVRGAKEEGGVPGVKPGAPPSFSLRDLCALRALRG